MAARSSWGGLGYTAHRNKPALSGEVTKTCSQVVHLQVYCQEPLRIK